MRVRGSASDDVELVALGVGERGPAPLNATGSLLPLPGGTALVAGGLLAGKEGGESLAFWRWRTPSASWLALCAG
jgi:hypothetical protein